MGALRVPTLAEIIDLFVVPASVDAAVAMLSRAQSRLLAVEERSYCFADKARERRDLHVKEANAAAAEADGHKREAQRSGRVADKLSELLS